MTEVELIPEEIEQIKVWGKSIHDNKVKLGTFKPLIGKNLDPVETEIASVGSELAVHKYFLKEYKFKLFDVRDEQDIIVAGLKCDVKAYTTGHRELRVKKWHLEDRDIQVYIAVTYNAGDYSRWFIQGIISKKRMLKIATLKDLGYSEAPMYCVSFNQLKGIEELGFMDVFHNELTTCG